MLPEKVGRSKKANCWDLKFLNIFIGEGDDCYTHPAPRDQSHCYFTPYRHKVDNKMSCWTHLHKIRDGKMSLMFPTIRSSQCNCYYSVCTRLGLITKLPTCTTNKSHRNIYSSKQVHTEQWEVFAWLFSTYLCLPGLSRT